MVGPAGDQRAGENPDTPGDCAARTDHKTQSGSGCGAGTPMPGGSVGQIGGALATTVGIWRDCHDDGVIGHRRHLPLREFAQTGGVFRVGSGRA